MKIITYCKTIDLTKFDNICFDYDRAMVSFENVLSKEVLYFTSKKRAMEFLMEITEAIHEQRKEINLSYFITFYGKMFIKGVQQEIQERIKKYDTHAKK